MARAANQYPTKQVNFHMPTFLHDAASQAGAKRNVPASGIMSIAVREWMERNEPRILKAHERKLEEARDA